MQLGGRLIITTGELMAIFVLFDRFGSLVGWNVYQVAFIYGIVNISFAVADALSTGFDAFGDMVKSGDFDRILTRPRSTALQLAGQELTLRRVSRLTPGLVALAWAAVHLDLDWTAANVGLLLLSIAGGASLFAGLIVLQATLAFWTTETLEMMNTLTYGGVETTQYPINIYRPWFRNFFTFGVPLACVSYFPALAIMGTADPLGTPLWFQYLAPLIGIAFLILSLQVWRFGVRHYLSTGS
jgi:ABC-2 type transport system permease protein